MYQSTAAFGTLVQQDSRTFKCLLTYGETSITTVRSIKFTGGSEGEDDFSLGSTMSQYIEVTIPGKGLVVEGTELFVCDWKLCYCGFYEPNCYWEIQYSGCFKCIFVNHR